MTEAKYHYELVDGYGISWEIDRRGTRRYRNRATSAICGVRAPQLCSTNPGLVTCERCFDIVRKARDEETGKPLLPLLEEERREMPTEDDVLARTVRVPQPVELLTQRLMERWDLEDANVLMDWAIERELFGLSDVLAEAIKRGGPVDGGVRSRIESLHDLFHAGFTQRRIYWQLGWLPGYVPRDFKERRMLQRIESAKNIRQMLKIAFGKVRKEVSDE